MSKYLVIVSLVSLSACGSKADAPAADTTAAAAAAPAPAPAASDTTKADSTKVAGDTAKAP